MDRDGGQCGLLDAAVSDAFWMNLPGIIGAIAGLLTLIYQIWSKRDAKAGREDLKATVQQIGSNVGAKVDAVQETATRSQHEITQAFMAGERSGYVGGIEEGKKQSTGPAPLQ